MKKKIKLLITGVVLAATMAIGVGVIKPMIDPPATGFDTINIDPPATGSIPVDTLNI